MQTYARQGGTSAIFINDDGMQLLSPEEREKRTAFYANHNIGWVARPPHSNEPLGGGAAPKCRPNGSGRRPPEGPPPERD